MIALHFDWSRRDVDPQVSHRIVASLGVGIPTPAGYQCERGVLLAQNCPSGPEARRWEASPVAGGGFVLFDGYIDNDAALRLELGLADRSPSAIYAAGYARWGDVIDARVIGQYACVIVWPDEQRVRCVRSPFHAPPLHYIQDSDQFIVASTARILFAAGEVKAEIDEQKIADSLYLNYGDFERGWFKGVRRVGTGARVVVTPHRIDCSLYYDLNAIPQVRFKKDEDYVEAANALLLEGTRNALKGFSNPAVSLSGGLDSQAVAASAIAVMGDSQRLLGLTSVPVPEWRGDDPVGRFGDERHHVAALAAMYPTLDTELLDAAGLSFDHKLSAMFLMAGVAPRNAMNLHWIHALHARAKQRGCDVILLGSMGNYSFSFDGSGAYPTWLATGRWIRLTRELAFNKGQRSLARTFASQAVLPLLPDAIYHRLMRGRGPVAADPFDSWCGMNINYATTMRVRERADDLNYDAAYRPVSSTRAYRQTIVNNALTESGDIDQAFRLIHGIPTRDPTAYRPLVEFCFGLPDDQYLRNGHRRWLAHRMLAGKIPDMVLNEKRIGVQSADTALRIEYQRSMLIAELASLRDDSSMAERFDIPRLQAALERWSPTGENDRRARHTVEIAIPRVLSTARFIRFVEGTNLS